MWGEKNKNPAVFELEHMNMYNIWQYFNIRVDLEELTVTLACYQVKHRANMQLESTVIKTEVHQRSENK